jgi:DUF4097 and DUF4098 domain-containing protein YvlB
LVKGDDLTVDETEAGLDIASSGNLTLMVPSAASVTVAGARGDLVMKNMTGTVTLDDVAGDARLRDVGEMRVGVVHGDLSAKSLEGPARVGTVHGDAVLRSGHSIEIGKVYGDLSARYVKGDAKVVEVLGDISLRNVEIAGTAKLMDVLGDIRLGGGLGEGKNSLSAAGDVIVRWPKDQALNLTASGSTITNRIQFDHLVEEKGTLSGQIGDGNVHLSLSAKGRVILRYARRTEEKWDWESGAEEDFGFSIELEGLGERISMEVNEHMARLTSELERKLGPEYSQRLAERVAEKAERAARKAERVAQKAMRQAEHSMRRAERRGRWRGRARVAPKKKASNEEQLKILKMVERGIISTDEATTLLEALES